MKTLLGYLGFFGALVALIAAGEIPPVHALSDWTNAHRSLLLPSMIGMAAVGLLVMIWGWITVGIRYGRSMTPEEAKEFMGRPLALPGMQSARMGRFKGVARGRRTDQPVEWSFREMKDAWRAGASWRDGGMRRKYLITAGGLWLILSGFSVSLVLFDPPAVKLMIAGAVIYAVVRTAISFRRA